MALARRRPLVPAAVWQGLTLLDLHPHHLLFRAVARGREVRLCLLEPGRSPLAISAAAWCWPARRPGNCTKPADAPRQRAAVGRLDGPAAGTTGAGRAPQRPV